MPLLETETERIWFDEAGERGTPVLLIMGFGLTGNTWLPQIRGLKESHRVVWYDHPGIGRSTLGRLKYDMTWLADQAIGILDKLNWQNAHVVGVSMGGMIAQQMALKHGHRVRSLTLMATTAGGPLGHLLISWNLQKLVKCFVGSPRQRARAFMRLAFTPEFSVSKQPPWFRDIWTRDVAGDPGLRVLAAQTNAIRRHNTGANLHRLGGLPTSIFVPEQDCLIPPFEGYRLGKLIPGSKVVRFGGAGHGLNWQFSNQVNERLLAHFDEADEMMIKGDLGVS